VSVFGGWNGNSNEAFRQATHLPNAQIYLTRVCYFSQLAENMQSVVHEHFLSVKTDVPCKMKVSFHSVKWRP